jgi:hypothetical protein
MIKLNSKGMKEDLGVGIAFYIIGSPVQFLDNGLLLTDIGKLVQPVSKIFFVIRQMNIAAHDLRPDGLLEQVIEISKELFLLFSSEPACFFHPFGLGDRAGFND